MVSRINGADLSAMWQELLKRADKDNDGKVSKAEFKKVMPPGDAAGVEGLFNKIDVSGDGLIDESENAAALGRTDPKKRQGMADPLQVFNDADNDGDGKISKSDFKAALPEGTSSATANKVFDSMDTNQDGVVSAAEYMAALRKTDLRTQAFPQEGFSTLA